jgi:hypothetical protein
MAKENGVASASASPSSLEVSTGDATAVQTKSAVGAAGVDLLTGPDGDVRGFSITPAAKLYAVVDQLVANPRLIALPVAQRYALAGQVAAVPTEHARLIERLAAHVGTSLSENGALNALFVFDVCKDLVPGFAAAIPPGRLEQSAELSPHERVRSAVLQGQVPPEWEEAKHRATPSSVVLLGQEEPNLISKAGRAVGDATKLVSGVALGRVGFVTDSLGITRNAEGTLAGKAEGAVDLVGQSVGTVVDTIDGGLEGTTDDVNEKGVVGAVGDGVADAVDMVTDLVGDAVNGIAGGVRKSLNFLARDQDSSRYGGGASLYQTHRVAIVVGELFGEERSLGLRIENRVVTSFTKPDAERLGWKLGDCIAGVGQSEVSTQDDLLAAIAEGKVKLKTSGTPIRFLVERLGAKPAAHGPAVGTLIFVEGRPARVKEVQEETAVVEFQDDFSVQRVVMK